MNCPSCGVKLTKRVYDVNRDLITCVVCGKKTTARQAERFAQDPEDNDEELEPWQK